MSEIDKLKRKLAEVYRICAATRNCAVCPCNNGNRDRDCEHTLLLKKRKEAKPKGNYSFRLTWSGGEYRRTCSFEYEIVAKNLQQAKATWEDYIRNDEALYPLWTLVKEQKAVFTHGIIFWREEELTNKAPGVYELPCMYYKNAN